MRLLPYLGTKTEPFIERTFNSRKFPDTPQKFQELLSYKQL